MPKQVNPNIAQKLIAEVPPIETDERVVYCDGGHFALGHPRVYIKLVSNILSFLYRSIYVVFV